MKRVVTTHERALRRAQKAVVVAPVVAALIVVPLYSIYVAITDGILEMVLGLLLIAAIVALTEVIAKFRYKLLRIRGKAADHTTDTRKGTPGERTLGEVFDYEGAKCPSVSNTDCSAAGCDGTAENTVNAIVDFVACSQRDGDSSDVAEAVKAPSMTELVNSVVYLRRYQDWRTGKDVRTMREADISGAALTVAINDILTYFDMPEPLTDCTRCAHNSANIETSSTTGCQWTLYNGDATCDYSEVADSEEGE